MATGGFIVVEKEGEILAQSWVWRHDNMLIIDSIEYSSEVSKMQQRIVLEIVTLYQCYAVAVVGQLGITQVCLGTERHLKESVTLMLLGRTYNLDKRYVELPLPHHSHSYSDASRIWLLAQTDDVSYPKLPSLEKEITVQEVLKWSPVDSLLPGSGVYCEYCEAEVHPDCEICPSCHKDISEWVDAA
jgi:hypothetical protein